MKGGQMDNPDDQTALNKPSGEEAAPEAPPASTEQATNVVPEGKPLDEGKPTPEVAPEAIPEGEGSLDRPPKKGAEARIRQLSQKAKQAEAKSKSLANKLEEVTAQLGTQAIEPQTPPLGYRVKPKPILEPGEEIDTLELEKRMQEREQGILQKTQALISFQGKVNKVVDNINREAREVIQEFPELDPTNEQFDKELSDAVTEATEAQVRTNPTASVKKLVKKLMNPYRRAVTKEVGEQTANLAKQVTRTALRPTPAPKGGKKFKDLSTKEMEDRLGTVC